MVITIFCCVMMMAKNHQLLYELMELKIITIEFYGLSKSYNITRWQVFFVGNPKKIKSMYQVKTNVGSGVLKAIQKIAIETLAIREKQFKLFVLKYHNRRDVIYHREVITTRLTHLIIQTYFVCLDPCI